MFCYVLIELSVVSFCDGTFIPYIFFLSRLVFIVLLDQKCLKYAHDPYIFFAVGNIYFNCTALTLVFQWAV